MRTPRGRLTSPARVACALAAANARYWTSVAPRVHAQLSRWSAHAGRIEDPRLRSIATGKLREERFNAKLAATFATLAPRRARADTVEAIVALQIAYDYLDVLGEQRMATEESGYLCELLEVANGKLAGLPAAGAVTDVVYAAMERAQEAQARCHAGGEVESWAEAQAAGSGLGPAEWLAGAQASVLCAHALIAAAADPATTRADAEAIDSLYLSIAALTMLDGLVDREHDRAAGALSYPDLYRDPEQMGERLAAVAAAALAQAHSMPDGAHHAMTLTGVVAFYSSAPAAADPQARVVFKRVRAQLRTLLAPTLAVMRLWRMAEPARGCGGLLNSIGF